MPNKDIEFDGDQRQPWMSPKLHVVEMRYETRGSVGPNIDIGDGSDS